MNTPYNYHSLKRYGIQSITGGLMTLAILMGSSLPSASAVVMPSNTPSGSIAGGIFASYFTNLSGNCVSNTFVTGFGATGIKTCTPYSDLINQIGGIKISGAQLGDTIYYDGTNWVRNQKIYNNGTNIGIGGVPSSFFEVKNGTATYLHYKNNNIGIGENSIPNTSLPQFNIGIGAGAFKSIAGSNATNNIGIGSGVFQNLSTGRYNIGLGRLVGNSITTGQYNILIGHNLLYPGSNTSNYLNIGDTLFGNISTGYIGIKKTNPTEALDVVGNLKLSGNATIGGNTAIGGSLTIGGNMTVGGDLALRAVNVGDGCATLGAIAYEASTGETTFCSTHYKWSKVVAPPPPYTPVTLHLPAIVDMEGHPNGPWSFNHVAAGNCVNAAHMEFYFGASGGNGNYTYSIQRLGGNAGFPTYSMNPSTGRLTIGDDQGCGRSDLFRVSVTDGRSTASKEMTIRLWW